MERIIALRELYCIATLTYGLFFLRVDRKFSETDEISFEASFLMRIKENIIITHLAGQTYVWRGCKWNFAGPQIYLQPAKITIQHFGVLLKFLVCN